jgi:hypothetical protein
MLMILAAALAAGCGALGPSWDEGMSSVRHKALDARDYINPTPNIDTNRYKWDNPNQEKLSLLFSPVDAKVMALQRYVTSIDYRPDAAWVDALLVRFPWIDGILVADDKGEILARKPPVPVKRFSSPLVFESIWRETTVKTVVDYTTLGPELYFGMPNYQGAEFKGLHVVYFDPRVLFSFCPKPEDLLIIDPRANKIWTYNDAVLPADAQSLTDLPWLEMMKQKVHGVVTSGNTQFTWLARFIGRDLFVYATESANASFEDKGFKFPFFGIYGD